MKLFLSTGVRPGLALALAGGGALLCSSCNVVDLEPPQRLGPPSLVVHEKEPRLWLLVKQEEQKRRVVGLGRRTTGNVVTDILYHFDLQAHDSHSADRLWKTRLLTVRDKEGGHTAQARILGQDGEVVWLFLHDQPVAVSSRDGSRLADRALLEERNAALRGVLSKEQKFYVFDEGLVIITADSRRFKVSSAGFEAKPYQPANDDHFRSLEFLATRWNGGYQTGDFLTRQAMLNGRWLGLYTEKEAADAGDDGFGDSLANPESVVRESSGVRRNFWRARIGKTGEFPEGSQDRLFDLTRVQGAPDFLDGGLLVREGTRLALNLEEPAGLLVLHRTRLDQEGRAALTRVDESLHPKWTTQLPFTELRNRFEFADRILLYGLVQLTEGAVTGTHECIAALDLQDGQLKAWNVTLDRHVESAELK